MTKEQIENWRDALVRMIGPYALMMPDEEIEKIRDMVQNGVDSMDDKE
jgi:hypothetical protein